MIRNSEGGIDLTPAETKLLAELDVRLMLERLQ